MTSLCCVCLNAFRDISTWWRHQMETSFASLAICARNSTVICESPAQRPVTRSFDVFFDLLLNKRLRKNGEADDLGRHRTHYDVTVVIWNTFQDISIWNNPIEYIDLFAFDGIIELEFLTFRHALRRAPDLSKTGESLRYLFISYMEGGNKSIDLKPLIVLEELHIQSSGLNEVPVSIRHIWSTIHYLDLAGNCIKTLENMENEVFRKLVIIYLQDNCIYHLNHFSLQLPALETLYLSENHLTHLSDMSMCQWGMAYQGKWFVTISLNHNPWHCNGSMHWLQTSLCIHPRELSPFYIRQPQGLIIGVEVLVCHSPEKVQRQALNALNESELNKLEICSKGEYHSMMGLSLHDFSCIIWIVPIMSV